MTREESDELVDRIRHIEFSASANADGFEQMRGFEAAINAVINLIIHNQKLKVDNV